MKREQRLVDLKIERSGKPTSVKMTSHGSVSDLPADIVSVDRVLIRLFLMYERISFNFLHYKLLSFRNVKHLNEIHLITSRAADNSENTSTLKIKSHNINSLCVHHNSEPFKHIKHHWENSLVRCYAC